MRRETRVLTAGYMTVALLIGAGFAMQVAMISAMGRLRGPLEGTWVSLVATIAGFTLIMAVKAATGTAPLLPAPFTRPWIYLLIAGLATAALSLLLKGIAPYFAVTGLFPIPLLVGAGFLGPRLGVGLYLSCVIAGQLMGSVALDHFGAFGTTMHRIDAARLAGIAALLAGVLLIRGGRG